MKFLLAFLLLLAAAGGSEPAPLPAKFLPGGTHYGGWSRYAVGEEVWLTGLERRGVVTYFGMTDSLPRRRYYQVRCLNSWGQDDVLIFFEEEMKKVPKKARR